MPGLLLTECRNQLEELRPVQRVKVRVFCNELEIRVAVEERRAMGNRNRRDEAVRGALRDGFLWQVAGEIPGQGPSILRKRRPMH